jgi:hypothetical protein
MWYANKPGLHKIRATQAETATDTLVYSTPKETNSIYIIAYILKLYEPTGVVVTEISLSTHPHADYISLILSVLE